MKKEKNFSDTDFSEKIEPSDKKALESLSDDEILQGFKDAGRICYRSKAAFDAQARAQCRLILLDFSHALRMDLSSHRYCPF